MVLNNKSGQNMVEFAIVIPVFLLLIAGFMHMALVLHDYLAMGEATREIARYAVVGKPEAEIRDMVKIGASGFYKVNDEDIKIENKNNQDLGDYVEISVTMNFDPSKGILLTSTFMPKQLSTTLKMRKE